MARSFVGQRKPSGQPANPEGGGSAGSHAQDFRDSEGMGGTPPDKADASTDPDDAGVQCPNCDCVFDEDTQDVIKPGKPVEGGSDAQGQDLEVSGHPIPGPSGTAHDAAAGDSVMADLLSGFKGRMGGLGS